MDKPKFAIIGLGFIAQKHLEAIEDVGGELVAACDIDESKQEKVGDIPFYTDYLKMFNEHPEIEWVSICTPNYLHKEMCMDALVSGKKVICEKPFVLASGDLAYFSETDKIFTVFQLRFHKDLIKLREEIRESNKHHTGKMEIKLHRGDFYWNGWKGDRVKSGGMFFNIGVHYFDLLLWLFGKPQQVVVNAREERYARGVIIFEKAEIQWVLSLKAPMDGQVRKLTVDYKPVNLSNHFEDLHTEVYRQTLEGRGIHAMEALNVIELLEQMQ